MYMYEVGVSCKSKMSMHFSFIGQNVYSGCDESRGIQVFFRDCHLELSKVRAKSWWGSKCYTYQRAFLLSTTKTYGRSPNKQLSPERWTLSQGDHGLSNGLRSIQCSLHLNLKDHDRTHLERGWEILATLVGTSYHLYQQFFGRCPEIVLSIVWSSELVNWADAGYHSSSYSAWGLLLHSDVN